MIIKEIYVPIYSYMIRYIEVEDFSYKEKRKFISYIKKLGYYDDFINDINNIMNNKGCGSGTTYHNNQKIEICVIIYPQPNEDRRIETIMHEKRHCEDFILEKLDIDDMEAAAYLAGWLAVKFINK